MKLVRMIDDYITDKKFSLIYKNNKLISVKRKVLAGPEPIINFYKNI